jgi:DNA-binding IclR family transcriptional regulator
MPRSAPASLSEPPARDGTQAIRRAGAMLKAVAKAGGEGAALAEVARAQGLPRSTAHRILKCLVDEGFLEQAGPGQPYRIGGLIHELGLTSASSAAEIAHWRRVVEAVAARTGVTCYLMRRSGVESVCLAQADGRGVMRFVPVEVGQRRLLGVGGGATALLAALPPDRIEQVIRAIAPQLAPWPRLTPASLRTAVKLVQRTGFAVSQGTVVPDGFGLGLAVPDDNGPPHLAISIAAHAALVTESAITAWKKVMAEEVQAALAMQRERQ